MSTRKRRLSPSRALDHQPTKRARLLSDLWPSESSHPSQSSGQSIYTIKAIIGEKPGEYLIDWADNRYTGEAYSPDWVQICLLYLDLCPSSVVLKSPSQLALQKIKRSSRHREDIPTSQSGEDTSLETRHRQK
ncbi:MAG: hypothetical protein Q9216_004770 [Gyalolechia sp. 2 TL-2023]